MFFHHSEKMPGFWEYVLTLGIHNFLQKFFVLFFIWTGIMYNTILQSVFNGDCFNPHWGVLSLFSFHFFPLPQTSRWTSCRKPRPGSCWTAFPLSQLCWLLSSFGWCPGNISLLQGPSATVPLPPKWEGLVEMERAQGQQGRFHSGMRELIPQPCLTLLISGNWLITTRSDDYNVFAIHSWRCIVKCMTLR